jgi:retron-type reverse transcriptase
VGTVWFIEGDISKCFDRLDHTLILSKLREHIKDERFIRLIAGLLKAGYLEEWRWNATYSGAPQGSIISPMLSNLSLDALDTFVETILMPEYTRGTRRKFNPAYEKLMHRANYLARKGRKAQARALRTQAQRLPSIVTHDPDYRRLRYCRYADDFLLDFIGPKAEAEVIKEQLRDFLRETLKLELSETKTLITHARTETARFLNYAHPHAPRGYQTGPAQATQRQWQHWPSYPKGGHPCRNVDGIANTAAKSCLAPNSSMTVTSR